MGTCKRVTDRAQENGRCRPDQRFTVAPFYLNHAGLMSVMVRISDSKSDIARLPLGGANLSTATNVVESPFRLLAKMM